MNKIAKRASALIVASVTAISSLLILMSLGPAQTIKPATVFVLSVAMTAAAAAALKLCYLAIDRHLPKNKSAAAI